MFGVGKARGCVVGLLSRLWNLRAEELVVEVEKSYPILDNCLPRVIAERCDVNLGRFG
jgi:hypothetical protein